MLRDGVQGVVIISEPLLKKYLVHIDKVLADPNVSARDLASLVGKIISMSAVLGNLSSIMTKHCQMSVAAAQDWDTPSPLDRYCIVELEFWKDSLRRLNSRDLFTCNPPFISAYSDASDVACGGHILGKDICAHRMFTNAERTQSSKYRELASILFVLKVFRPFLSSSREKWFTDNQMAARIVQVGSMHFEMHLLASDIFSFCYNHGINLEIDWVPRSLNDKADYLSKIVDYDYWEIVPKIFQLLDSRWGPHIVHCFATFYNFKVPRFFSGLWNPGSSGVDAFFQTWQGENCWVVPPVVLLSKVLKFMSHSRVQGPVSRKTQ